MAGAGGGATDGIGIAGNARPAAWGGDCCGGPAVAPSGDPPEPPPGISNMRMNSSGSVGCGAGGGFCAAGGGGATAGAWSWGCRKSIVNSPGPVPETFAG